MSLIAWLQEMQIPGEHLALSDSHTNLSNAAGPNVS